MKPVLIHWVKIVSCSLLLIGCASRKRVATGDAAPTVVVSTNSKVHPGLGIVVPANVNPQLLAGLEKWRGVPYKLGGNTAAGIDCSGLILQLYKEVYQQPTPRTTADLFAKAAIIPVDSLQEGDLVFFSINSQKTSHAGMYLWDGFFYHASTSMGVMVSSLQEAYWKKYFTAAGRLRKSKSAKP
jgi:murein DD-endopeptidase / murein LD-carboxypeptidase